MIRAIIIDDEKSATEMLEWLLENYCPDVKILATYNDAESGLLGVEQMIPDLLFLDIEMPGMNGFDLLEKISHPGIQIVFTTAHDQFAVRAFRFAALNYLLKPIDPDELQETIARFSQKKNHVGKEQWQLLMENLNPARKTVERIALSTNDGLIFVKTSDITYCKADSNYTQVVMADGKKITVARTLKEIDETLAGSDFSRVHNSFLVNINHIKKYVKGDGGYIVMPDDCQITISRSKRDDFFQLFSKF